MALSCCPPSTTLKCRTTFTFLLIWSSFGVIESEQVIGTPLIVKFGTSRFDRMGFATSW